MLSQDMSKGRSSQGWSSKDRWSEIKLRRIKSSWNMYSQVRTGQVRSSQFGSSPIMSGQVKSSWESLSQTGQVENVLYPKIFWTNIFSDQNALENGVWLWRLPNLLFCDVLQVWTNHALLYQILQKNTVENGLHYIWKFKLISAPFKHTITSMERFDKPTR